MDDAGNITGITKRTQPGDAQDQQIQDLYRQRTLDALQGNLPVDPALESSLSTGEQQLRERLTQQLGSGYETSTPGIEALEQFRQSAEGLRFGARTGQLTLAEQLGLSREQQQQAEQQTALGNLTQSAVGNPLTFAGAYGQIARGYGQAAQPYAQQRALQAQIESSNTGRMYQLLGAGIGAAGQLGAAYMLSDPDLKDDMVLISRTPSGVPIYVYTLRDTGERLIGVLSTDAGAAGTRKGWDVVDYSGVQ